MKKKLDNNKKCGYGLMIISEWLSVRLECLNACIVLCASLLAITTRGQLSPGFVGLALSQAINISSWVGMLTRAPIEVETEMNAVERLLQYNNIPKEGLPNAQHPPDGWPSEGKIELRNVEMKYRPTFELVLKNISTTIGSTEKIGVVGRTGAGKSSLILCFFRMTELFSGSIIIDGIDISTLHLKDLRSRLCIIPQDPIMFSGTVRTNLDPFDNYNDEEIWQVLEWVNLKSKIENLQNGLSHAVAEYGENFSVGQRQLICLARALLKKSKLLFLDEATASVDVKTDALIQKTVRDKFNSSTVITIAHRLNTIMDSNRVMVLNAGNIVEFESPEVLLQNKTGFFSNLVNETGFTKKSTN